MMKLTFTDRHEVPRGRSARAEFLVLMQRNTQNLPKYSQPVIHSSPHYM